MKVPSRWRPELGPVDCMAAACEARERAVRFFDLAAGLVASYERTGFPGTLESFLLHLDLAWIELEIAAYWTHRVDRC